VSTPAFVAIADELLAAYDHQLRHRQQLTTKKDVEPLRMLMAYGLCAQAYDLGQDALRDIREVRYGAATPLVREVFECAVHAQLLVLVPDAHQAMFAEDHRLGLALAGSMAKAASFVKHEAATRQAAGQAPATQPSVSTRSFEATCNRVDPAGSLYIMYRVLSSESHAGVPIVERWFESIPDPPGIARRTEPRDLTPDHAEMLAGTLALSLMWAAAGLDVMLRTRPLVRTLNLVSAKLGHNGVLGCGKLVMR
jgi:hypothetical protein